MLLSIIRYIRGYVLIKATGFSAERFLNTCSHRNIYIWGLHPSGNAYNMYMKAGDFRKLKPIIKKTGTKVIIEQRFGLPFFLHRYRKRKMFLGGAFLCVAAIYVLSLFIWNIDIRGNNSRTDEMLLTFLAKKEVACGMKKSHVDCGRIAKDIRLQYDDVIWVSASIQGTKLIIQVKENEDSLPAAANKEPEKEPADIVADRDGTITKIITRKGVPLVKEGAAVKKGDVMVCGRVPVINDSAEVIAYRYQHSDADIIVKTVLSYEEVQPFTYTEKLDAHVKKEELFIRVGAYRFGLGNRIHEKDGFEVSSKECQWMLGDSFYLPVTTGKRVIHLYRTKEKAYSMKKVQELLSKKFARDCEELEKKGVEILENDVKIYRGSKNATAKGTLTVIMPIGKKVPTEVVEIPAKNMDENDDKTTGDR